MSFRSILLTFLFMMSRGISFAAEDGGHHGLTAYPMEAFKLGPLIITNSMVVTILVAALIVIFAQLATKNMKMVPTGLQNFAEWLVESLYNFLEGIMGPELVKKTFWFFGSLFIFILATNWFGLIPGIGTVGWMQDGHFIPWLRGGNADLNMTLGMAMVFFVVWFIWAIQANGVVGFLKHIFMPTKVHWLIMIIFFAVGIIEVVSIAMRPVALSFRLYGNVFAGENMLETMLHMSSGFGGLLALPFYFLELLVGIIQAMVFMLLTALFTTTMCSHADHDHDEHGEDHDHTNDTKAAEGVSTH